MEVEVLRIVLCPLGNTGNAPCTMHVELLYLGIGGRGLFGGGPGHGGIGLVCAPL